MQLKECDVTLGGIDGPPRIALANRYENVLPEPLTYEVEPPQIPTNHSAMYPGGLSMYT